MPRVDPVDPKTKGLLSRLFLRVVYAMTRRKVGRVVMPVQLLGHHPRLLFGYGMMEDSFARSHTVSEALKNLVQVRVASLIGCPF